MIGAAAKQRSNLIGKIPVQNIWLLMAYAAQFSHLNSKTKSAVVENFDELPELVTDLLCRTVEARLKKALSAGFLERRSNLTRVRGKIDHLKTVSEMLLYRGQVACAFSELSYDTPRNQFVRFALLAMSARVTNRTLSRRASMLVRTFGELGVSDRLPSKSELSRDRLGRHDVHDKEMIELAKLALELSIPSEYEGVTQHYQADKNEYWVRKLFEKAIAGFYRLATKDQTIRIRTGTPLYWPYTDPSERLSEILPSMKVDIIIDNIRTGKRLVIDTKFNQITENGWMREETLRSGYLYQIYAYLRTQEESGDTLDQFSAGLLLHPSIGETVFESLKIQTHRISFATIDLTESAGQIKEQLLVILDKSTAV